MQLPTVEDHIGPYTLVRSLGRGGMAEVFVAVHRHLGVTRAVKIVTPERSSSREFVTRLLTEARATARLRHPAVVEVVDCDVLPDGRAFIAMEYLEGEHLGQWLARTGKLAGHPRLAAALVGVVATGLGAAHAKGIVHRDLKPENLFLVQSGDDPQDGPRFSVKIFDFGIAKLLVDPLSLTRAGSVLGTPLYMAPEQWRQASDIDHRADIYALGCVFFELLHGQPPFLRDGEWEMMWAHVNDPPPSLAEVEPEVPAPLVALVARMLAKEPNDRPQTTIEVVQALEAFLGCGRAEFPSILLEREEHPLASERPAALTLLGLKPEEGVEATDARPVAAPLGAAGTTDVGLRSRPSPRIALAIAAVAGIGGLLFLVTRSGEPPPTLGQNTAVAAPRAVSPAPVLPVTPASIASPAPGHPETLPRPQSPSAVGEPDPAVGAGDGDNKGRRSPRTTPALQGVRSRHRAVGD